MSDIQKQFIEFHNNIKLDDENQTLREKRDIILSKLKANICDEAPKFTHFVQGSYSMGTGIQPTDGDFDIDVGLRFEIDKKDYAPVAAKMWVYDALKGHTNHVEMKTPCVTVTYSLNGQPSFHVDLTVYAANNPDGHLYLAKGRRNSKSEYRIWERSDPSELKEKFNGRFSDSEERAQFKRIIHYMKRWKDLHMPSTGYGKVTGLALSIAAWKYMEPKFDYPLFSKNIASDVEALIYFVESLLSHFDDGKLILEVPITETAYWGPFDLFSYEKCIGDNLLGLMTSNQMQNFNGRLETLLADLKSARSKRNVAEACGILQGLLALIFLFLNEARK